MTDEQKPTGDDIDKLLNEMKYLIGSHLAIQEVAAGYELLDKLRTAIAELQLELQMGTGQLPCFICSAHQGDYRDCPMCGCYMHEPERKIIRGMPVMRKADED